LRPRRFTSWAFNASNGALSKASIWSGVRYFGNRLASFGKAIFLIGEAAIAPWRIRNL
jgi:hypothetical protein